MLVVSEAALSVARKTVEMRLISWENTKSMQNSFCLLVIPSVRYCVKSSTKTVIEQMVFQSGSTVFYCCRVLNGFLLSVFQNQRFF